MLGLHKRRFDCSCNWLQELPSSIGRFLESSNLKECHLSKLILTLKEYPMEACKLHLSVQDLSNNSLADLPPEIVHWFLDQHLLYGSIFEVDFLRVKTQKLQHQQKRM